MIVGLIGYKTMAKLGSLVQISNIALANIEALANNEKPGYSCTVTRDCGNGASVSCTGVESCEHVSGPLGSINGRGVKCDGNTTKCP